MHVIMAFKKTTAKSGYLYQNETMFIPSISQITKMGGKFTQKERHQQGTQRDYHELDHV